MNIQSVKDALSKSKIQFHEKGLNDLVDIRWVKSIQDADEYSLVWVSSKKSGYKSLIEDTKSKIIICDPSIIIDDKLLKNKAFLIVENPRLAFLTIVSKFFTDPISYTIHKSAILHPEAKYDKKVHIGPNTYIGKCKIGKGTIIHGNCFIYDNTTIGKNVTIQAGTIIGSEGYGYERDKDGVFRKFPHVGGVVIEDEVDIGSNTCIDRGTLGDTLIKYGAKIDNLVQIAHNVTIGKHTAVIANAMVAGSTRIGDFSWVSPSVTLRDGIIIGDKSTIGIGSSVMKNIPNEETWVSSPAEPIVEYLNKKRLISKIISSNKK